MCARITYLGELGYELYVPSEHAVHVYDRIVDVDAEVGTGLVHCGLKALSSLRLEKGYRDYGHDMDNTDTYLEVGLGFTADYDKPGGFIGDEAVKAQRAANGKKALPKRLVQVCACVRLCVPVCLCCACCRNPRCQWLTGVSTNAPDPGEGPGADAVSRGGCVAQRRDRGRHQGRLLWPHTGRCRRVVHGGG